jgi:hypothetical protein
MKEIDLLNKRRYFVRISALKVLFTDGRICHSRFYLHFVADNMDIPRSQGFHGRNRGHFPTPVVAFVQYRENSVDNTGARASLAAR